MFKLPRWAIPDTFPAFHDTESLSAIEMTARLYGAMQSFTDEYNCFAERIEKTVNEYEKNTGEDIEVFKVGIRQEFQDFIDIIAMKVKGQDVNIQEIKEIFVDNLQAEINQYLIENNVLVGLEYIEENEELKLMVNNNIKPDYLTVYDEEAQKLTILNGGDFIGN